MISPNFWNSRLYPSSPYEVFADSEILQIVGMSKVERVDEAVQAVNFELTKEEVESIDELYEPKKTMGFS